MDSEPDGRRPTNWQRSVRIALLVSIALLALLCKLLGLTWQDLVGEPKQEPRFTFDPAQFAVADPKPRLWEAPVAADVVALATAHPRGKVQTDIVVCCKNGDVVALSGQNGSRLWTFEAKSRPTAPAIGDLDGDRRDDVLVGTEDGRALAIAANGEVLWIHRSLDRVFQVGTADIDHDGAADAIIAYPRGVKVLSGRTAMQIALLEFPRPGEVHFALGDIDDDGTTDWVANYHEAEFNTRGVSGRDGSTLWMRQTGQEALSPPAIGDSDGDGKTECVYASQAQGTVAVFQGATGSELRRYVVEGVEGRTPDLADVNFDGIVDALVQGQRWTRAISGKDGSTLWSSPAVHAAVLCDVEGDGPSECVVADTTGIAIRSARDGSELARVLPHEISTARPVVAELDGDRRPDLVAAVGRSVRAMGIPLWRP